MIDPKVLEIINRQNYLEGLSRKKRSVVVFSIHGSLSNETIATIMNMKPAVVARILADYKKRFEK